ncbi:MAG TPA: VTT domain-containing protein [Thermoanaerobaculia bacterium]|nr:VTT domain-containing protein [Thermoanaerobaculia bacterium]
MTGRAEASGAAEAEPTSLRGPLLRFGILIVLLVAGFAALRWSPLAEHLDQEALLTTFRDLAANPWAPVALIAIFAALCPLGLPVSPLVLVGGLVFGFAWGTLWNFLGTWAGAATSFAVARLLGHDLVVRLAGRRLERVEHLVERHGFWALVRLRFVPIPYALVNYAAAFAGVRPGVFLTATAIGLAPAITLYTWFAAALFRAATGDRLEVMLQLAAALVGLFLLTFLPRLLQRSES